jgi:hypothetical protein
LFYTDVVDTTSISSHSKVNISDPQPLSSFQQNYISMSTEEVSFGPTSTAMNASVEPRVLPHPPQDHRYVNPEELKKIAAYNVIMNRDNTTIMDFCMTRQGFLKINVSLVRVTYNCVSVFVAGRPPDFSDSASCRTSR